MLTPHRLLPAILSASLVALGLGACGEGKRSGGIPDNAVAVVGGTPITKAALSHWMKSDTGGDYFEHTGKRAPLNLVADPPDYGTCVSGAKALSLSSGRHPAFTTAQLTTKCHQLYVAVKEQALIFLISAQWRTIEAAEYGLKISDAEVDEYFHKLAAQQFPQPGQFETYLADHEWVEGDELTQLKRNLLTTKLQQKIGSKATGGDPQLAFTRLVVGNIKKRTRETTCRRGYLVASCREFKPPAPEVPAPATVLEEFANKL